MKKSCLLNRIHGKCQVIVYCFMITLGYGNSDYVSPGAIPSVADCHVILNRLKSISAPYMLGARFEPKEMRQLYVAADADCLKKFQSKEPYIYSYITQKNYEKTTSWCYQRFLKNREKKCSHETVVKFMGDRQREVWRWILQYHYLNTFGTLTFQQQKEYLTTIQARCDALWNLHSSAILKGDRNKKYPYNFATEVMCVFGYYAMVFPGDTERSAKYLQFFIQEFEREMVEGVYDGAWNESTRYHGAVLRCMVPLIKDMKALIKVDMSQNPGFKSLLRWLVDVQTPPDKITGKGYAPALGDSVWMTEWYLYCGYAAELYIESDPNFAGNLIWAWIRAGRPRYSTVKKEGYIPHTIDISIPSIASDCSQTIQASSEKSHTVFRNDPDRDRSIWMLFRCGKRSISQSFWARHDHYDQGSFSLFAYGYPLMLDPGILRYDISAVLWYRSTLAHNCVYFSDAFYLRDQHYISADILKYEKKEDYDLVIGDISEAAGVDHYFRHVVFMKPDYFIIYDDIDCGYQSYRNTPKLRFHAIADSITTTGNIATVCSPYENIKLDIISLNADNLSYMTGFGGICYNPWATEQKWVSCYRGEGSNGFLTVLYPYRGVSDMICTKEKNVIHVKTSRQIEDISFDGLDWNVTAILKFRENVKNISADIGNNVSFSISIAAQHDPVTYRWFQSSDSNIDENDRVVGCNSMLTLKPIDLEPHGYYYCVVKDAQGNTITSDIGKLEIAK